MASAAEAALKLEIARLKGAINRHKSGEAPAKSVSQSVPRSNSYASNNKYAKPVSNKWVRPGSVPSTSAAPPRPPPVRPSVGSSQTPRDVVIDGVAFESSSRSLVRKDLPKPKPVSATTSRPPRPAKPPFSSEYARNKAGTLVKSTRTYKPKGPPPSRRVNRNMTLNNNRRPYQSRRASRKYVDKPCARFTTTGSCNRGLTCPYQHDESKIAICWPFLQGTCPHSADNCPLSHNPTPENTPLCVHFANNGRCNRDNCPFPHIRVGPRTGVCRDFAVLGFCGKGVDCEHQHVRECPDFAEKGECTTKGCKLPHVIRANRKRQAGGGTGAGPSNMSNGISASSSTATKETADPVSFAGVLPSASTTTAENAQLGDEFISLTFHESSESEGEDEDEEDESEEGGDEEDAEGEDDKEGNHPTSDEDDIEIVY
ncbi:uncharacterized protein STEHIDRAFT_97798 [Stereum hirsutum FP-91666 SS1]|uniref:uncharacterized protein n=1 Tax=Stereum hirsutum (strain FP-91666) TaxID=721885 RepID=UPI0004449D3D|nr:uncharacterized protein STEHIDRAFT_97798 [Stereum hirsutum FP-91666 SS1]EIM86914.1 hypothetical protein STEHIDRAFT_97798 [Stereum hirsutum FP-91666 SS1]